MLFCEIYLPRGAHTPEQLRALTDQLTLASLLKHDVANGGEHTGEAASADPGVLTMLADLNHVVLHEIGPWIAGGKSVDAANPRYLARFYLPAPWRKEMSAFLIAAVAGAIRAAVGEPQLGAGARVEVQVLGIAEGSYGMDGRVVGEPELMDMISAAKTGPDATPDSGALVDPVCGMIATDPDLTLTHDGVTYGFCSAGCRKHFTRNRTGEVAR
jgi:YHS domain-containing protein